MNDVIIFAGVGVFGIAILISLLVLLVLHIANHQEQLKCQAIPIIKAWILQNKEHPNKQEVRANFGGVSDDEWSVTARFSENDKQPGCEYSFSFKETGQEKWQGFKISYQEEPLGSLYGIPRWTIYGEVGKMNAYHWKSLIEHL